MKNNFSKDIPFDLLYQASLKEASRKKPVFFVHKYFARRITANFRLALLSYFNDSNGELIDQFYSKSNQHNDVTVLDPFMGGGTTILEALRFGCKVIGNDLQPLSLFASKALVDELNEEKLLNEMEKLEKKVGNKIKNYYKTICPFCGKEADAMYNFHVKKVSSKSNCQEHRLFSTFIIAYKNDEFTVVCPKCNKISKTKFENSSFKCDCGWELQSPKDSYINSGKFTCPECGETKKLSDFNVDEGYPFDTDIIAIEYYCPYCKSHDYKEPDLFDKEIYEKAIKDFITMKEELPIPDDEINEGYNTNQILNHHYKKFSDLFNKRQLLCLGLLLDEINQIDDKDTQLWCQVAFSGMLEMNNMFCRYQQNAFKICNIFFNHAYVPISMPVENCVWGTNLGTGTFIKTIQKIIKGKRFNKKMFDISVKKNSKGIYESLQVYNGDSICVKSTDKYENLSPNSPLLKCCDSRDLGFIPDKTVDFVLTDPPYGANIMYSELIDFFHVWNARSSLANVIGFNNKTSPKEKEIVINRVSNKDIDYYKDGITTVLSQCYHKLKDDGCLVFSFHDKNLESWIAVLLSITSAGFFLSSCYPVQSETRTGAHTSNKNSIGIDMMLICRKIDHSNQSNDVAKLNVLDIIENTKKRISESLEKFYHVDAEITYPDVQNMAIAYFYCELSKNGYYNDIDNMNIKEKLQMLLNEVEAMSEHINVSERRSGWWSELYRSKWNIKEESN